MPIVHIPFGVILFAVMLEPTHTLCAAVIAVTTGLSFTVIVFETESIQPFPLLTMYFMVVVPAATAVTKPPLSIVAALVLMLLQVPPFVVLDKVVVLFTHTADEPLMLPKTGKAFTVTEVETVL